VHCQAGVSRVGIPYTAFNKKVCYSMFSPFFATIWLLFGFDNNFYFLETTVPSAVCSLVCLWVIGVWTECVCFESVCECVPVFNPSAPAL
jgi:hypothetical protein